MFDKLKTHIRSKLVIVWHEEKKPIVNTIRFTRKDQSELNSWSVQNSEVPDIDFSQMYLQCQI